MFKYDFQKDRLMVWFVRQDPKARPARRVSKDREVSPVNLEALAFRDHLESEDHKDYQGKM